MRAEEARELATKAQGKADISRYLEAIKRCAIEGEFSVTFGNVKKSEIDSILKLGYEVEECESMFPNSSTITIKW